MFWNNRVVHKLGGSLLLFVYHCFERVVMMFEDGVLRPIVPTRASAPKTHDRGHGACFRIRSITGILRALGASAQA